MSANSKSGREALRVRFSEAAKSLTELYRDAAHSYDAGYRDALLYVHRYVLLNVPGAMAANAVSPQQAKVVDSAASSQSLNAGHLLLFIQNTLKRQEAVSLVARGTARQRKRTAYDMERHTHVLPAEGESGVPHEVHRRAPSRRLYFPTPPADECSEVVHDMLREVCISRPAEAEAGVFDDDAGAEMPWNVSELKDDTIQ